MDYGIAGQVEKAYYANQVSMQESTLSPQRITMLDRTREELRHAVANVDRLNQLIDLLERNPDVEKILNLMR